MGCYRPRLRTKIRPAAGRRVCVIVPVSSAYLENLVSRVRDTLARKILLALVLKKELEERIADLGRKGSWPEILADLDSLTETKVEQDDKCFLLRSPPRPAASLALSAAGVALPPTVRQVDQA
jgi:hypothetical protein